MSTTTKRLEKLCETHPKFLQKGGLCVALVVTQRAQERGLPIQPESLRTRERGQVAGLGKAAVQKILEAHGIRRVLAEEGGRTSRGSLGLMQAYVEALNELHGQGGADLAEAMEWWIGRVRNYFASEGPKFYFDSSKSLQANIESLLHQAKEAQTNAGGTNYVGAMAQHLIGAKLDLVLGEGKLQHHSFSTADKSTGREGDFQVETVVLHVTVNPNEALVRKCDENLKKNLKPVILTLGEGVGGVNFMLKNCQLADRVDVLDIVQFLAANVYERSLFRAADCNITLSQLLQRYNEIVEKHETDPSLKIKLTGSSTRE